DAGAQTLTVSGSGLSGSGRWQATGDLSLDGLATAQWDGTLLAGGGLTVSAASLTNRGTLAGGQVSLMTPGLSNTGTVSGRQVGVQTAQLVNGGTLSADEGLSIQAQTGLDNSGSLLSGGALTIQAGQTVNRGVLSGDTVTLSGDALWNGGRVQGRQSVGLTAATGFSQTADGALTSGGQVTVLAGAVDTGGSVTAQGLTLDGGRWRNQGTVSLGGDGRLTLDELDNGGSLLAAGSWDMAAGRLGNGGTLQGSGLRLRGDTLDNQGTFTGTAQTALKLDGALTNTGLLKGQRLELTAAGLDNGGTLLGVDALTLAITGTARNQASGRWLSQGAGRLTAHTLDNQGNWQSDRIDVMAQAIRNAGQLLGLSALTLTANDELTNTGTGNLLTQGAAVLTAASVDNDGGWQAGSLLLTADQLRNGGRIQSDGALTVALSPSGRLSNSGTLAANGEATLSPGVLDNRGTLSVRGNLTVAGADLHNAGQVATQGALTLKLSGDYDGAGDLYSEAALTLDGADITNGGGHWQGSTLAVTGHQLINQGVLAGERIALSGQQLDNTGSITGGRSLTVTLPGGLTNAGRLEGQRLELTAAGLDNSGTLLGVDALTLAIAGTARNQASGRWLSQGAGRLTAHTLDNQGQWQGDNLTVTAQTLRNAGELLGLSALTLTANDALTNAGTGRLLTQGAAVLTAARVDNDGEGQAGSLLLTADSLRNGGHIISEGALQITLPATDDTPLRAARQLAQDVQAAGLPAGSLSNSGTLAAGGDSRISAGRVENQGMLAGRDLTLSARDVINGGRLESRTLQLTGERLDNGGTLLAERGGELRLTGALSMGADGQLLSNGDWQVQAGAVNTQGLWQGNALTLNADTLANAGSLLATDGVTLALLQDYTGGAGSRVLGNGAVTLTADRLFNAGRLEGQRLELTAAGLDNSGTLLGVDALTLAIAGTARNQASGRWLSQGAGRLTATELDNQGNWQGDNLTVTTQTIRNAGQLLGLSALTLTANDALTNTGTGSLLTQGAAVLRAASVDNDGAWQADSLLLTADSLRNGGHIISEGALQITLPATDDTPLRAARQLAQDVQAAGLPAGSLSNTGTLAAGGDSRISAGRVENQGMLAGRDLTLSARDVINGGRLESRTLQLTGERLDNGGTLLGVDALTLAIAGTARNQASGRWLSQGAGRLTATALDNQGQWQGDNLTVTAQTIRNAGQLLGLSALTLTANDALTNTGTGSLLTQGAAVLRAASVDNDGEGQAGSLLLTADSLRNGGHLVSEGALQITLPATDDTPLRVARQLAQDVQAASQGVLSNTGTLAAGGDSRISAGRVENQGMLAG
ncbi:hemolysin BL-binding protein, partial [Dickeya sp. CFBP 2040]|uniref:beta strand repeat-containing protein n=1 Tax=Dickeya sp. CFBP 2040 TaxID=2718531 RepID=UPI00169C76F8|nr:hemolysin BL-binding protein [Dickeya sp. CFBP 2040]